MASICEPGMSRAWVNERKQDLFQQVSQLASYCEQLIAENEILRDKLTQAESDVVQLRHLLDQREAAVGAEIPFAPTNVVHGSPALPPHFAAVKVEAVDTFDGVGQEHENVGPFSAFEAGPSVRERAFAVVIEATPRRAPTIARIFECPICFARFNRHSSLYNHRRIHMRQYACSNCTLTFRRKNALDMHACSGQKLDADAVNFPPGAASQQPSTSAVPARERASGRRETEKANSSGAGLRTAQVTNFRCCTCSKMFRSKAHLQRHSVVHTGERPFICELCGKGFSQDGNLRAHCIRGRCRAQRWQEQGELSEGGYHNNDAVEERVAFE